MFSSREEGECLKSQQQQAKCVKCVRSARMFQSLKNLLMAPITLLVGLVFWSTRGLMTLPFGRTSATESVECVRRVYHSACMPKILTAFLSETASPVILRMQKEHIMQGLLLKERMMAQKLLMEVPASCQRSVKLLSQHRRPVAPRRLHPIKSGENSCFVWS